MMNSFFIFSLIFILGVLLGCFIETVIIRFIKPWVIKIIGLAIVFPCTMIAFFIFVFIPHKGGVFYNPLTQGLLNSPLIILPCAARYLSLPSGFVRSSVGLGATPSLRLQKLWLPLLALPLLLSITLTTFILTLYRAFW
ncbi:hypothetical protein [Neokomagataea anthophila]|uniref:ABC transmembrane type-1 domain-containing protein n=1 Tax=Neokomagataea anthophila TaxID=2826925 RepID=A0ABS5E7G1_9PROT|nr:hypothetical protein [Neokomagataea anthophila]MBR0559819.1 hypothetical protein [Neokomagataea anthophila]